MPTCLAALLILWIALKILFNNAPEVAKAVSSLFCFTWMAGVLAVILLLGLLLLPPVIVVALAVIAVSGLAGLWLYSRSATTERLAACFALLLLGAAFVSTPVLRGLLLPDIGAVIAAKDGPLHLPQDQVLFIGSLLDAAKVRLYMDREAPFPQMRRFPETGIHPGIRLVMTNEQSVADTLKSQGFKVEEVVAGWRRVEWQPFIAALKARDLIGARNAYGQRGWIATR